MTVANTIARNLARIRDRIAAAARRVNRDPETVRLVAITKTVGLDEIMALYDCGVRDFGENRLESARDKIADAPQDICWHFIAPLQTRKARDVVSLFSVADAVDRIKAAAALQRQCEEQDKRLDALIETNISGEMSKHGFDITDLADALAAMRGMDRLRVAGLMTMAPLDAPESVIRDCFRRLNAQADALGLPERSMGMTDDFEIAIEEGSTQVRIGRALFD